MHVGYGPQIGSSPEGFPIYPYTDPQTKFTTYVVVLPDGRAFYCDAQGRIVATPNEASVRTFLALVGGAGGFLLGGAAGAIAGAIAGAVVGAIAGDKLSEKRAA